MAEVPSVEQLYKTILDRSSLPLPGLEGLLNKAAWGRASKDTRLPAGPQQLGHASIAMTSLYADVLPEMNQSLANAILK